jgi:hypothetical protein
MSKEFDMLSKKISVLICIYIAIFILSCAQKEPAKYADAPATVNDSLDESDKRLGGETRKAKSEKVEKIESNQALEKVFYAKMQQADKRFL